MGKVPLQQNTRKFMIKILLILFIITNTKLLAIDSIEKEMRYAILIGIKNYKGSEIEPLRDAISSKNKVKSTLQENHGNYNIVDMDDESESKYKKPNKKNLKKYIDKIKKKVRNKKHFILFYYSGHGEDDSIYLYNKDSVEKFPIKKLISTFMENGIRRFLIVLDSCSLKNETQAYKDLGLPKTASIFYASQAEQKASEGYFTNSFIEAIEGECCLNDFGEVEYSNEFTEFISKRVENKTKGKQKPDHKEHGRASQIRFVLSKPPALIPNWYNFKNSPIWRSMLIPGWGQHYNSQLKSKTNTIEEMQKDEKAWYQKKSIWFFSGSVILGSYYFSNLQKLQQKEEIYKTQQNLGLLIPLANPSINAVETLLLYDGITSQTQKTLGVQETTTLNAFYILWIFWLWNIFDASMEDNSIQKAQFSFQFYKQLSSSIIRQEIVTSFHYTFYY